MEISISGWDYQDIPGEAIVIPNTNIEKGEVTFNEYVAKCTLDDSEDIAHAQDKDDEVVVLNTETNAEHKFSRTRYRACCNPVFFKYNDETFVIINTNLSTLTVYNAKTGAYVTNISAPEMMTAILGDRDSTQEFHLFGWVWGPHESYCSINIDEIMSGLATQPQ